MTKQLTSSKEGYCYFLAEKDSAITVNTFFLHHVYFYQYAAKDFLGTKTIHTP